MKSISIFCLTCLLTTTTLNAQNFEWAKSFGGTSHDFGLSTSIDDSGNVYTSGFFRESVDFNPGAGITSLTAEGNYDVFVQKMDSFGNFVWAKSFGGSSNDCGYISTDGSGNIYTGGYFQGTVNFDPGTGVEALTSEGFSVDIFVQKMDSDGNFLWAKSFGSTSEDECRAISTDAYGNIFSTGYFCGPVDFDSGAGTTTLSPAGGADIFVQKMDASGNFLWAKSFGGTLSDHGSSISTDTYGNVYITGSFEGTVDFDPGPGTTSLTSSGDDDIFVLKLDSSGNFLWVKSFGGAFNDIGNSIITDTFGNVYTTGCFYFGTVDFDPGAATFNLTPTGENDIFVQKMDSSGNFIWAISFGGAFDDNGSSISSDVFGNMYITGIYQGTVDFDPGAGNTYLISTGGADIFVLKLDPSGNFFWAKSFGGVHDDYGYSLSTDKSGNIYTTGGFQISVDFNPGLGIDIQSSTGNYDVFVQKMSPCNHSSCIDVITACNSYTWINGNTYTSSNNTATFTLYNSAGCDSVVSLNLTIYHVSDSATLNGITITANNLNASCQWLDCNNSFAPIVGETNQSFTATQNGSYSVEITENGCTDTSACIAITNYGIIENTFGEEILVYPIPTDGNFSIDLGNNYQNTTISIFDIDGKMIETKSFSMTQIVNMSVAAPAGVYLVRVNSGDKKAAITLVKE